MLNVLGFVAFARQSLYGKNNIWLMSNAELDTLNPKPDLMHYNELKTWCI